MRFVAGVFDRIILVAGVLLGGGCHSFILSYQQRVAGHLDQALLDLQKFQDIADRYHEGNLQHLINLYSSNVDPSLRETGLAIESMWRSTEELKLIFSHLQGNSLEQVVALMKYYDQDKLLATWEIYEPSFSLSIDAFVMAALVGGSLWALTLLVMILLKKIFTRNGHQQ